MPATLGLRAFFYLHFGRSAIPRHSSWSGICHISLVCLIVIYCSSLISASCLAMAQNTCEHVLGGLPEYGLPLSLRGRVSVSGDTAVDSLEAFMRGVRAGGCGRWLLLLAKSAPVLF